MIDLHAAATRIFYHLPYGVAKRALLAGGYFRSQLDGTPVKDIDLFFRSLEDYQYARGLLEMSPDFSFISDGVSSAPSYHWLSQGVTVNLVGFAFTDTLEDLVDRIDFTCCTCAAEWTRDGLRMVAGPDFVKDATSRTLRFNHLHGPKRARRRVDHYRDDYGYAVHWSVHVRLAIARIFPTKASVGLSYD